MPQYETIMKHPGLKTKILFGMILAAYIFLSLQVTSMADGPQNKQGEQAVQPGDLDSVVLHLKWYHQFKFAGYYAAVEKGFFREVGLDVTLVEGSPNRNVINEVLVGRAFEPLFTTRARGMGLGLAIVQKIVEEHGGSVSISSEPNRGTKAIVMIPGSNQIGD